MDSEITPQTPGVFKLPPFLTTITAFSKTLALSMLVVLPILGFFLGIWYQKQLTPPLTSLNNNSYTKKITKLIPTPSLTPEEEVDCDPNLSCEAGKVYFINDNGQKIVVAEEVDDSENPINSTSIKFASISPNKKFISIGGTQWESVFLDVYEISTAKTHSATATGGFFGDWLPDNRILVIGGCGMGIDCGIFVSKNNQEPWNMKQVFDAPDSWRK
jgi:hypothetical protein